MDLLDLLARAKPEYARVVALPLNGYERVYLQPYMAFLRDFIAVCESKDSETVQNEYETHIDG